MAKASDMGMAESYVCLRAMTEGYVYVYVYGYGYAYVYVYGYV